MLLAEELTLLALDPEAGRLRSRDTRLDQALAATLLLDLSRAGHLRLDPDGVIDLADTSPRHPVLGMGLSRLTGQVPLQVRDAVLHLGPLLADNLLESMAERGIVRRDEHRTLVLKLLIRWHATTPESPDVIRTDLSGILGGLLSATDGAVDADDAPVLDTRTCGLFTVLGAADLLELAGPSPSPAATVAARAWCAEVASGRGCVHSVPAEVVAFQTAVHEALAAQPALVPGVAAR